jgi:uncharacterized cupredoxin-like copper-binding protein
MRRTSVSDVSDSVKVKMVWPVAGFFVVIAFGVGLVSMAAFESNRRQETATSPVAGTLSSANSVNVELGELYIKPDELEVAPGEVTFNVENAGSADHNFAIVDGDKTPMIPGGGSEAFTTDLEPGTYQFICEVQGHAEAGMKGTLTVAENSGDASGTESGAHGAGGETMSAEEMVQHDMDVTGSFPAKTKGVGGTDLEPRIEDGVKVFELTADEITWEVTPGETKQGFAYNGMIPGPAIRAELGDRVRMILHNELDNEPTTIHFHGMTVPNDMDGVPVINQDAVMPGERFVYEFTVRNTGTNMYHSHMNAAEQVPKGLLGAFIVPDPKDEDVDQDVNMILNDGPLGFSINGKGFPATAPLSLERGETVRIRYMNEGLMIHPMHLHGMPQKVVAKDGHRLPRPYMADTVLVGPGERYDVIVEGSEPGAWAFHCHVLNHAEGPDGMFGMVTAMIVE